MGETFDLKVMIMMINDLMALTFNGHQLVDLHLRLHLPLELLHRNPHVRSPGFDEVDVIPDTDLALNFRSLLLLLLLLLLFFFLFDLFHMFS